MVFGEPAFLFWFLPIALALHTVAPAALRNPVLLAASLVFYAWGEPVHVLLLLVSIAFNWMAGLAVAARRGPARRTALTVGVVGNLLLLGHFKYLGFVAGLLGVDAAAPGLPIGISFFTFQALSYLIDVGRGRVAVQRSPLRLGLYVAMFPQLVAGPIVRYADIEHELGARRVTAPRFAEGVERFAIGLAKKLLVADTLAGPADRVFALSIDELTTGLSWLGLLCYAGQIYFDFSGYSDMAIGLGRMFGFHYRENFDHPYESRSIREFWRRWHISLSTWFRDYLYLPLGGSRGGPARTARNLWIVFLLCGLWHGASLNFLLFGAWHGTFLVLERLGGWAERLPRPLAHGYALGVVLLGWLPFRAETLGDALALARGLAGGGRGEALVLSAGELLDPWVVAVALAGVAGSTSLPARAAARLGARVPPGAATAAWRAGRTGAVVAGLALCLVWAGAETYSPFIYFRF